MPVTLSKGQAVVTGTAAAFLLPILDGDDVEDMIPDAEDLLDDILADEDLEDDFQEDDLSPKASRVVLEALIEQGREKLGSLTQRLIAGKLGAQTWKLAVAGDLALRATAATLALISRQPDEETRDELAHEIGWHWNYLDKFAKDVKAGKVPLDGRTVNRTTLYADAAWRIAMAVELARNIRIGVIYARRVLGSARHCHDCLEFAERGWEPIDEVVPIGDSQCQSRCHCWIEYK